MNAWSAIKSLIFVCLAGAAVAFALTPRQRGPARQTGASVVIVNGRTLTGPNSSAITRGGRTLVPTGTVAAALGAAATLDAASRRVTIERQNGVITVFDAQLGQVRENGTVILSFSGAAEIAFAPRIEEMMLPVEIAAALFDVSIRFDVRQNAVVVTSGHVATAPAAAQGGRGVLEVYQAGYQYDLDRYSSTPVHSFGFNAVGRLGDGRFYFTSNSSSSPLATFSLRRATFDVERTNGQHLTAGDFTSGWAMPFLTANIRGVSASAPFHGLTAGVFGGRAFSGGSYLVRSGRGNGFDTNIFGAYVSKSLVSRNLTVAAGGLGFSGPIREGRLATVSANYTGQRLHLQADTAVGDFEDRATRRAGLGGSVDLAGTYQVTSELALQGRVARSGINFIAPQGGVRDPVNITAAGISWSPAKWLSASVNASSARRPGETGGSDNFVTVAGTITPSVGKPRFYFSHTASDSRLVGSGAFTLITAAQDFRRWHVYMNATRVKAIGPASINGQFGASKTINDRNSIELSQGLGSRGAYNGLVDWRSSGLAGGRLSFTAGGGYSRSAASKLTTFERLTASLQLPREASMQVSYVRTNSGPTLLLSIRGTLFKKREAGIFVDAGIAQANNFSSVSGRVYQDVNENGVYDSDTDKPQRPTLTAFSGLMPSAPGTTRRISTCSRSGPTSRCLTEAHAILN